MPETLNHLLQVCYVTHTSRIKRHDAVVKLVARELDNKQFSVFAERLYQTPVGALKPDIVAFREDKIVVVDVQVINDQFNLEEAHFNKVSKYDAPLRDILAPQRSGNIVFTSLILNWRGCISRNSVDSLLNNHLINPSCLKLFSTQTLLGGSMAWTVFSKMTARTPSSVRTGVG